MRPPRPHIGVSVRSRYFPARENLQLEEWKRKHRGSAPFCFESFLRSRGSVFIASRHCFVSGKTQFQLVSGIYYDHMHETICTVQNCLFALG